MKDLFLRFSSGIVGLAVFSLSLTCEETCVATATTVRYIPARLSGRHTSAVTKIS